MPDEEDDDQEDSAAERASWSRERTIAETLAAKLILQWQGPISTLRRAGKAFEGLEALLGGAQGGGFDLGVGPLIHPQFHAFLCLLPNLLQPTSV